MKRVYALLLVMLLLGACAGQAVEGGTTTVAASTNEFTMPFEPTPPPYEVGSVTIISNGIEHEPYEHYLGSKSKYLFTDGTYLRLEDVFEKLPIIRYADDFQVAIRGRDVRRSTFTLYNENLQSISLIGDEIEKFSFPDETGTYVLDIQTKWERDNEYVVLSYVFKIRR